MIKRVYGARDNEGRFASWPRVPSERRPPGPALWMETMFLVAGLAVAGLVGIAAAFYFSIRSGNRGGKRLRPARPDLSGVGIMEEAFYQGVRAAEEVLAAHGVKSATIL